MSLNKHSKQLSLIAIFSAVDSTVPSVLQVNRISRSECTDLQADLGLLSFAYLQKALFG